MEESGTNWLVESITYPLEGSPCSRKINLFPWAQMANVRWQFILQESMLLPKRHILTSRCRIFMCIKNSLICRQESPLKWELSNKTGVLLKIKNNKDKMTKSNFLITNQNLAICVTSCHLTKICLSFLYWSIMCKSTISKSPQTAKWKRLYIFTE